MKQTAVILVNTGTPDTPSKSNVRKYLSEFLNDPRVIDMPWLFRKILVNLIIVPFRAGKSAALYRRLWTQEGSPLRWHLQNLIKKLNEREIPGYQFFGAMRYGNPSIRQILKESIAGPIDEIVIVPLYPQYASSTTGSVVEETMRLLKDLNVIPPVRFTVPFYDHEAFLSALITKIQQHNPGSFDHILFSYHGLPENHIHKIHPEIQLSGCKCDVEFPQHGRFCYRAACYRTTRLLAEKLNLEKGKYSSAFQSRLSKKWLTPFSDHTVQALAVQGIKNVLVVAPSFVADCLETTLEIGDEYAALFREYGGQNLQLVGSLNDDETWVDALMEIIGYDSGHNNIK
jgi:protoporphyrin/coproporphyrin ferrochelatase